MSTVDRINWVGGIYSWVVLTIEVGVSAGIMPPSRSQTLSTNAAILVIITIIRTELHAIKLLQCSFPLQRITWNKQWSCRLWFFPTGILQVTFTLIINRTYNSYIVSCIGMKKCKNNEKTNDPNYVTDF